MKLGRAPAMAKGLALLATLAMAPGCGEKIPYPPATPKAAGEGRPSAPAQAAEAPAQAQAAVRPIAIIRTPEGSFIVSARPGDSQVTTRRETGLATLAADGKLSVVKVVAETARAAPGAPESRLGRLMRFADGKVVEIVLPEKEDRPDLAAVAKADPDLAASFYYREALVPIAMSGTQAAYLLGIDGFLGGAHPTAQRRLVVVDIATGSLVQPPSMFAGRDLSTEVLGAALTTACTRRPAGIAPAEGRGGETAWIVGLAHDVESCAGQIRIARIPSSVPELPQPPAVPGPGDDGALRLSEAVSVGPVADWRFRSAGGSAVLLMANDRSDRVSSPWEGGSSRKLLGVSRELRFWNPGMAAPVVLGRASSILSVEWASGDAG